MDYTLASNKSPDFEDLCFNLTKENGHPEEFMQFRYESHFSRRSEIIKLYPNKFRNLPEMYLLAKVIDWFTNHTEYETSDEGVHRDNVFMSHHSIMQDVHDAAAFIHSTGSLKSETANNLQKTLIAPSASQSSLASSKTPYGQAALQRFWFRVGSSFRAIDFDHVPDLPFFIARVAEILEIDAGDLYLLKYGFLVSSASFDNDLLNRSDRLYDVRVRLRGGQDQEAHEGARIAPTPMYLPPPFFLGTDQTPDAWLVLVEIALGNARISGSREQFNALLPTLPAELLTKLAPSFAELRTSVDPYQALLESIRGLYKEPKAAIFSRYFKEQSLGAEKPSVFLKKTIDSLETLQAGITKDDAILRPFFLSVLPPQTQAILAVSTSTSLIDLASMADKIAAVSLPLSLASDDKSCHAVTSTAQAFPPQMEFLVNAFEKLNARLDQVEHQHRRRSSHSRGHRSHRSQSKRRNGPLCSYHEQYANRAKRCFIGCGWVNRPAECQLLDLCVFHGRYKQQARRCLEGCRHFTAWEQQSSLSKN